MHSRKNTKALSDKQLGKNLELLDLVVGTWTDQDGSIYSVQLDGGLQQDTCSVFTTRKNGQIRKTQALIRIYNGKVVWGHNSYTLDRERATLQEIAWIPNPGRLGPKSFRWTRRKEKLSQKEIGMKVKAMRDDQTPAKKAGKADVQTEESPWDYENESDDDDIVAEEHPWQKERRPIPVEDIRWSQDTIGIRFRDGQYLVDMLKDMLDGRVKPGELPAMHVVLHEDLLFAITGNRRLWVLKNYGRIANKEVKVFAEVHPPKAMEAKWVKRRYTSTSCGEEIRFLHKSFANTTYATMEDALMVAEGPEGARVKLLQKMEHSGGKSFPKPGKAWAWQPVIPEEQKEEEQKEDEQKEDEQAEEDFPALSAQEMAGMLFQDEVAQRALLKLLSPSDEDKPSMPEPEIQELNSMAGTQLCFAAGLLLRAADASETQTQTQTQTQLRDLSYRLQEAAGEAARGDSEEDSLAWAAQRIQEVVEEVQWIDCSHDLGMQLLQCAQWLEMASWSTAWTGSPACNASSAMDESYQSSPTVLFLPAENYPQPQWLWQWQMAGQMAQLRSMCGFFS